MDRRLSKLSELGHNTVNGLRRREPALREEFPIWVICVDEGTRELKDNHALEQIDSVACISGRVGIHFIVAT
ncbi:hypothetical protein Pure05_42360 [Paenarthrobacter ureafaciens]|nr:hypothetical protein Pure01_42380 [Paenarthrobacter ureafaciens]GLU65997.1 hypothetical protein Pure02_42470 [Paenarthrobacter ureafaciens]GLU69629.1 hypothetical protein Pure03_36050 [Paenarthrobacter ureafaciens]GLU74540.1 hypothetical protein Pure04_42550 [Paenarthrobacter ureafaciens]GLU78796.1 hypothetical protein Pure05_42360 [Paenarthrobacter ureafaciens]